MTWYIDGGHTLESIKVAGTWFAEQMHSTPSKQNPSTQYRATRVLLFNQQTRDADVLARALHKTLADALNDDRPFTHAVFCTNTTFKDAGFRPDLVSINTDADAVRNLEVQNRLAKTWNSLGTYFRVSTCYSRIISYVLDRNLGKVYNSKNMPYKSKCTRERKC